ncbi:MAG TPA: SDR family NAD(P)-dependent oxidoreductase [Allosphingosinicella sp.]|nr:SDR family NAD(P)-dependent oxidoreductase [Allosphingosinicella sp.]
MSRIAIIGFQGRFPGNAKSSFEFFEQLLAADSFCGDVPADRWSKAGYVTKDMAAGKTPTGRGSFLDYDYRSFDPDVFALSTDEIAFLDPQQRLVLEVAWEALEQAAIDPYELSGEAVGVYVGGFTTDHLLNQFSAPARGALGRFSAAGSTLTMLANRLSYALDLRGPSFTVDTACASSLTALAAAVRDLQAGACRMALAGGVSFMLRPEYQIAMSAAGLLAVDGRSKPFSNLADGYGRGEGCGMLVLKPLADACADNDRIWAVIEAIGTGHDGRTAGISLPNGQAQADLMRQVLATSGLTPNDIGYVEAHGTGTMQGDRIEARSIGSVYGRVARGEALPIGSVKANIGHLEAAAGIAGVIKALLILQSGRIPPHLLVGYPNSDIPFEALNLRLLRDPEPLKSPWVAVNAFGYGGSNAHVILGPPPDPAGPPESAPAESGSVMLPLSAQSAEALSGWLVPLSEQVEAGVPLVDLQYTLVRRRGHRPFRSAIWVDRNQAPASIAAQIRTAMETGDGLQGRNSTDGVPRALFVFSGMGAQWSGMGRSLWASEPVFRESVEELDAAFHSLVDFSLIEAMTGRQDPAPLRCRVAQPLNFALQVGLVRVLSAYGLDPDICLGHSAGEVAAAYCAGHLPLDQAVSVCWARSELQDQRAGGGAMLVAATGGEEARALCAGVPGLEIAAFNARRSVAFAGPESALSQAEGDLDCRKVPFRRLPVDIAYHSADMDPILALLQARLEGLDPVPPAIPLVSSVTAKPISRQGEDCMGAAYWLKNVREPVRFHEALETAFDLGATHCIEIGPRPILHAAIAKTASDQAHDITVIPTLDGDDDQQLAIRNALTRVYVSGGPLNWQRVAPAGKISSLPVTGWQRKQFWHEADVQAQDRLRQAGGSPWAEPSVVPQIRTADLNREVFAFLCDHRIEGVSILPGTAALEAALQTALAVRKDPGAALPARLTGICFENPFPLNRKKGQVLDSRHIDNALEILAYNPASPAEALRVLKARIASPGSQPAVRPISELAALAPHPLDSGQHHARLAALGIGHGPSFQVVQRLSLAADGTAVLAQLAINGAAWQEGGVQTAPCLLDGVFQAALALTVVCEPLVPVSIRSYTLHAPLPRHLWAWITLRQGTSDRCCFDADLRDSAGQCLAQLEEIVVKPLTPRRAKVSAPDMSLIMGWREAQCGDGEAKRCRISVVASDDREGDLLRRALTAAGADVTAGGGVDATAVLVPEGPRPLADRMGDLLALCTNPAHGRIYLITRNAQAVSAQDFSIPDQAAAWGLGRTLFNEVPETGTTMIDVAAGEAWHAAVAREIAALRPSSEVAFRNGRRLLPRLSGFALAAAPSQSLRFHRSKTYLVTGGLGGFGQQLALWLAQGGAGRIILTSRSRPPQARLAPLARELSNRGAELTVAPLDLTDRSAVRALLIRTMSSDAPLGGIFHWAGMTIDRPATAMTVDELRRVLAPKADGADALHEASLDLPLDHFVLASSLSSIVGNPRQANYAAANAYLDGLAWSRHAAGLPALSVNFGAIAGTGMAAHPVVIAHLKAAGLPPMSAASALAGLGAALLSGLPQVSLSRAIDGERWMRYDPRCAGTDKMSVILGEARAAGTRRDIRAELRRLPAGNRVRLLADHLRGLLAQTLKCPPDRLSRESPLSRTGMDSLAALEFQLLIDRELGISLPITALIGGQTLSGIGAMIARELADAQE